MYVCLCTRLGLPICRSVLLARPMNGGNQSPRPLGTTAGHVPFQDLLYRGLEEGLVVAPPPRPRTSHTAGSRYNMFVGMFSATFAIILAAVIIWATISPRSPEHLNRYQMTALLVFEITVTVLGYLIARDPDDTI